MARELGFKSRQALYEALTLEELREWEALYSLDPWGPARDDLRIGILCSLTDACHRTKGKPEQPIEYMPYVRGLMPEKKPMDVEAMKRTWNQVAELFAKARPNA